jgi:hypothetical protein
MRQRPSDVPAEAWWSDKDDEWILGARDDAGAGLLDLLSSHDVVGLGGAVDCARNRTEDANGPGELSLGP